MACQICGKPSGYYPLCNSCFKLRDAGKVIKCDDCGSWHYSDKTCSCKISFCQICGIETDGYDLCREHNLLYKKGAITYCEDCETFYLNKYSCHCSLSLIQCINCGRWHDKNDQCICASNNSNTIDTENILDDIDIRKKWPAKYRCKDGHYVGSRAELTIDNWLCNEGIQHFYEKKIIVNGNPDDYMISDFFIPKENIYIENFGVKKKIIILKENSKKLRIT